MNLKVVGLLACAGYGIWYAAIGGKQVSEDNVRDLYASYVAAFDRQDAKAVCDMFSDSVFGKFTSTSRSMPVRERVDKASACASVQEFVDTRKRLEAAMGQELYTTIEYTINGITIAPDKKSARAGVLMEMRIGTEQKPLLDMRATQTDIIKRNFGKARFTQSDGTVSFFH